MLINIVLKDKTFEVMKVSIYILALVILSGRSTVKVSDSWVNKTYINYQSKKILIEVF
jgi:hypothetical protein